MIDIALRKPLPNSAGLYLTNYQWSMTLPAGPWMAERRRPCKQQGRVAQSRPRLIPSILYVYPWLLHCLPLSPGPFSPSTANSRQITKTSTTGDCNFTFPHAHPRCAESARRGSAEATCVSSFRCLHCPSWEEIQVFAHKDCMQVSRWTNI